MKITNNCSQCGKKVVLYRYKKQVNYFCNSKCYTLWQTGRSLPESQYKKLLANRKYVPLNVSCDYCDKEFHKVPSNIHLHNFCCKEHQNKYKFPPKRLIQCRYCGITFKPKSKITIYCSRICCSLGRKKAYIIKKGYKKILFPSHPRADTKGYVFEHIVILEKKFGRRLKSNEVSHHKDKNKLNNHPDNLTTFLSNSIHLKTAHSSKCP